MNNMHAFDPGGRISHYGHSTAVMRDFFPVRAELYRRRRAWGLARGAAAARLLQSRGRFLEEVSSGDVELFAAGGGPAGAGKAGGVPRARPKAELEAELRNRGYDDAATLASLQPSLDASGGIVGGAGGSAGGVVGGAAAGAYDYLLGMRLWSFTEERATALAKSRDAQLAEMEAMEATSPEDMWRRDLEALRDALLADASYSHNRDFDPERRHPE